jgi:hypothetical protein
MAEAVIEEGQDAAHSRVVLRNEMTKDLSFEGFHEHIFRCVKPPGI